MKTKYLIYEQIFNSKYQIFYPSVVYGIYSNRKTAEQKVLACHESIDKKKTADTCIGIAMMPIEWEE